MAAMPFMPLYVADYLSDAAHLSTVEHGAYLLLIMTYWQRGEALPDDDKKLARICRVGPREWARMKPAISEFFEIADGNWFHSRVQRELQNVRAKSLKKRNGGLARAKQMHSDCSADAQLTDTDTDTEYSVAKATGASADPDRDFWRNAKSYLAPYVGGESKAGSLIGKWAKGGRQPEAARAISAAQVERAVDPVAYIEAAMRRGSAANDQIEASKAGVIW